MLFDKIEILYEKYFLPIKIKFSESRKPTFIEFLVLSIILDYKNTSETLKNILENEFEIKNQVLFEKALRDLINFQIIQFKELTLTIGETNTNIPIGSFVIKEEVKKTFNNDDFIISNNNKFYDIKYFYDPIQNDSKAIKDIDWLKKIPKAKLSYKIKNTFLNKEYFNKNLMIEKTLQFFNNNSDIIGLKPKILDIVTSEQQEIKDFNLLNKLIKKDQIAIETCLEINNDGDYKLLIENDSLQLYIEKNQELKKEFVKDILKQYKSSLENIFSVENNLPSSENFFYEVDLISNININSNWNLLLINDQHIYSQADFFKNKELTRNIEFVIFYNSKRNSNEVSFIDNKIIIYINNLNNDFLNSTTFTYISSDNKIKSFLISNFLLDGMNIKFPVTYLAKVRELNVINIFEMFLKEIKLALNKNLFSKNFSIVKLYLKVLERFGQINLIKDVFTIYIKETINEPNYFNELKLYLKNNNLQSLLKLFKDVSNEAIMDSLNDYDDDNKLNIIEKLNINSKTEILKLINALKWSEEIQTILRLNKYLEKKYIDGWLINIANSINVLLNYFYKDQRENLFDTSLFSNSSSYIEHTKLLNELATMNNYLYKKNFIIVEELYNKFITNFIKLLNTYSTNNDYLIVYSKVLKEFYQTLYEYQSNIFSNMDTNEINYKVFYLAINYVSKLENKLLVHNSNDKKLPIELFMFYLKNITNNMELKNTISNNLEKIELALKLIFGVKNNYSAEDLNKLKDKLGD
ncbi:hypothetical protein [Spiroplasma turonicum]|uniref:Uncharacterized protein n=1 Tax=Spiroplasma turonicum TaxID=216946 RepID=A0A0K1P7F6_9MOLU|nr:hypothetical protein [Spiroplasma turonicum]AKU80223.1 hypothetical protein STURON_00977 [Spiroplasma turonicum]ALX71223.1 hypothetical protein STURO_v1c09720 [Spiroplasma turonicum]